MHSYIDDRGASMMSIYDHLEDIPGQINVSRMYAGAIKAWHRHALQDDHWCVIAGDLKIGLFNNQDEAMVAELRLAGSTAGQDAVQRIELPPRSGKPVYLGEHRPGVLRIPRGVWHGGVATGGRDAMLMYYVTRRYDTANPDEERAAWDLFAFAWNLEHR